MLRSIALVLALSIACAGSQTSVPDSPPGQTLRAWLDAFNSGDRARVAAFIPEIRTQADP